MQTVEIITHALYVRDTPSLSGYPSSGLLQGQQAIIDTPFAVNVWLHVVSPHVGYIFSNPAYIKLLDVVITPPNGDTDHWRVNTDQLNVRTGPGVTWPIVAELTRNLVISAFKNSLIVDNAGHQWRQIASQTPQWFASELTVPTDGPAPVPIPVPPQVPVPPNSPQLPWTLPFDYHARGVHGNAGGWAPSDAELHLITINHIETIFIVAWETNQAAIAIPKLRAAGIKNFVLRAQHHGLPVNPADFVARTLPNLKEYQAAIGSPLIIQVMNEPNIAGEGYLGTWPTGAEFATFWVQVVSTYRQSLPGAKFGFPALSPGAAYPNIKRDERQFAQEAAAAFRVCDWIGLHAYWTQPSAGNFAPNVDLYRQYNKPIIGTEIGPVAPGKVDATGVLHAYSVMANYGIPCMAWVLDGTGSFPEASWTLNNLVL